MTYTVELTTVAFVRTTVVVNAESKGAAEAAALRLADAGDVVWEYNGVVDSSDVDATATNG